MSDYTPTTEEVLHGYHEAVKRRWAQPGEVTTAEFHRWLAEHDREQRAIGWDEGYDSGEGDGFLIGKNGGLLESERDMNPYREVTE